MRANKSVKQLKLVSSTVLLLACGAGKPVLADINDIYAADNAIEFRVGAQHQQYRETYDGATLDTENGWITSLGGGASVLVRPSARSLFNNMYMRLDAQVSFGETDYDGGLQDLNTGDITPYKTTTKNIISNVAFKLGYAIPLGRKAMVVPYAEYGYRLWGRESMGPYGYTEDYHHSTIMAGAMFQYSPAARWVWSLSAQAGSTFSPEMRTGGENFKLRREAAFAGEARASYAMTKQMAVFGGLSYNQFRYGESDVQPSGFMEPDSLTREYRTSLGIAYTF